MVFDSIPQTFSWDTSWIVGETRVAETSLALFEASAKGIGVELRHTTACILLLADSLAMTDAWSNIHTIFMNRRGCCPLRPA